MAALLAVKKVGDEETACWITLNLDLGADFSAAGNVMQQW
jgi:hypothetical protein